MQKVRLVTVSEFFCRFHINFTKKACKKEGFDIGGEREYGIAQFFFPQHEIKRAQAKKMFEIIVEKEGLELLGWRTVPVIPEVLGHKARELYALHYAGIYQKTR